MLERVFGLRAHDTTVRRELLGGATTFATMAYIVVVNPAILGFAGIPRGPSTVAAGRFNEVKPGALVLAAVCAAYDVFGLPH